jgi:hypothetical protein
MFRAIPTSGRGVYISPKNQPEQSALKGVLISFRIAWPCAGDGSFKFLPYQLSMVG